MYRILIINSLIFLCIESSMKMRPQIPIKCSAVFPPSNGFVTLTKSPHFIAAYRCYPGYSLYPVTKDNNGIRKCQSNGQWSGIKPTCKSEQHSNKYNIIINFFCERFVLYLALSYNPFYSILHRGSSNMSRS